jgi:glucosamine--fructose-6-phosphate aminotransferase (isomerizing)
MRLCGIVGILGRQSVSSIIEALKRLVYRGYDSAGLATLEIEGHDQRGPEPRG